MASKCIALTVGIALAVITCVSIDGMRKGVKKPLNSFGGRGDIITDPFLNRTSRVQENFVIFDTTSNENDEDEVEVDRKGHHPANPDATSRTGDECDTWNCTCQGASDLYRISHRLKSFAKSPANVRQWWHRHKCNTNPPPILKRPAENDHGGGEGGIADRSKVCYIVPTRLGDGRKEVLERTWAKDVLKDVYFVVSTEKDERSYVDWKKNTIHLAWRNFTDSSGKTVPEYEPDGLHGWQAPLVAKIMKLWEFISMQYESEWSKRCAWFVKSDDDTWINARLIQQRLQCMDPDVEVNFGYSCGFGVGIYTGYSRAVVRNFKFFIQELRKETEAQWFVGDIEDRRIGQVLMRFDINIVRAVRRNGTTKPDMAIWEPDTSVERKIEWIHTIPSKHIGCMSIAHHSRPAVMEVLAKRMTEHLEENNGVACPNNWQRQGMDAALVEAISRGCDA